MGKSSEDPWFRMEMKMGGEYMAQVHPCKNELQPRNKKTV